MSKLRLYASEIEERFDYNPLDPDFLGDGEQIAEFDSNGNEVTFCYDPDSGTIQIAYGNLGYGSWDMLPEELMWSFTQKAIDRLAPYEAEAQADVNILVDSNGHTLGYNIVVYCDESVLDSRGEYLPWVIEVNEEIVKKFGTEGALLGNAFGDEDEDIDDSKFYFMVFGY